MSLNKFTLQKGFAISEGAGSGKTYTLSRRYINAPTKIILLTNSITSVIVKSKE